MSEINEMESHRRPTAILAEKAVLSCMIQNPKRFLGRAFAEGIDPECFYLTRNVYDAVIDFGKTHPDHEGEIEMIEFVTALQLAGTLDRCGGPSQIADICSFAPSFAGWSAWGEQLREAKARRMVKSASERLAEASDSCEAIADIKTTLTALRSAVTGKMRAITAKAAARNFVSWFENAYNAGDLPGESTGLDDIDRVSGGMRGGELWIVAAKPSRGKSVLMLQFAAEFIGRGKTVAVFSLEMVDREVIGRLTTVIGDVSHDSITQPKTATNGDLLKIKRALGKISESNLWIDSSADQSIESIQTEAERIRDITGDLSLVVVDYIQLIRGNRSSRESREEEVARVSGGLKQLAKRLGCPVVSGSQLNENGQTRESRAIEQDADALLYIAEDGIKIGKLRSGKRDDVFDLFLDGEKQRFVKRY